MEEDAEKSGDNADEGPEEGRDTVKEVLEGILIHGERWIRRELFVGVRVYV